ncbi:MAG: efflux RND transporter periplasmic adaptor subunit [Burkholderiales bacterium]
MNTKKATLLLALLMGTVMISACGNKDEAKAAEGAAPKAEATAGKADAPRPVRTMQAGISSLADVNYLPGEVRPRYEQRYGFRVPGKIARRLVDVGQEVKAGQVLAVLDSADVLPAINAQAAQVEVARTDFNLQQSELKRQKELRDKGFVSGAALERQVAATEAADARVKAAQSQLANAQNGLAFQTLKADRDGVVVGVDAEAGSVVAAGQSVVRVAQLGEKELLVNVPERAVALMKQATGFMAHLDAVPGKLYSAKLRELSPAADAASRTYTARLSITNADDALKLGMSATVRLDLAATQAIVVPNTALYTRDSTPRVWVVDRSSETVRAIDVKLGESTADGVAITAGLKPGDIVVTAGANLLLPGQKVRLLEPPPVAAVPAAAATATASAAPANAGVPAAATAAAAPAPAPAKAAPAAAATAQAASKP